MPEFYLQCQHLIQALVRVLAASLVIELHANIPRKVQEGSPRAWPLCPHGKLRRSCWILAPTRLSHGCYSHLRNESAAGRLSFSPFFPPSIHSILSNSVFCLSNKHFKKCFLHSHKELPWAPDPQPVLPTLTQSRTAGLKKEPGYKHTHHWGIRTDEIS